jgi:hypothetical protein
MAKPKPLEPVTVKEVEEFVLHAILNHFEDRPIDQSVIRRGLAGAAWRVIELHMKGLESKGKGQSRA